MELKQNFDASTGHDGAAQPLPTLLGSGFRLRYAAKFNVVIEPDPERHRYEAIERKGHLLRSESDDAASGAQKHEGRENTVVNHVTDGEFIHESPPLPLTGSEGPCPFSP